MFTVSIMNRKGGVGKTTTAHTLGAGLHRRGMRILFTDLDDQANLTAATGAETGRPTLIDALTDRRIRMMIQQTDTGDIIAADGNLAGADLLITEEGKAGRLLSLLSSKPVREKNYDCCIIDTPPGFGILTVNALAASDMVIIPVQADILSVQGMAMLEDTIVKVRRGINPALVTGGILITRYNGRTVLQRDMAEEITAAAEKMGTKVYRTRIRECTAMREAQAVRQDIFTYAPRSNAARDYGSFIDEAAADIMGIMEKGVR